jgi:hypothetical protein
VDRGRRALESDILTGLASRLAAIVAPPCGSYRPFRIADRVVGWVDPARAALLGEFGTIFVPAESAIDLSADFSDVSSRTDALEIVARELAGRGALTAWRDERYAIAERFGAPPLCLIERAAARFFGIRTYAVHVNGIACDRGADAMWIARRSAIKPIDPSLLDNFVGGGIAWDLDVERTLIKEAAEEAGVPEAISRQAQPTGVLHVCRARPDGLQRESIFVHDLRLPDAFVPCNADGEVAEFRCVPIAEAARLACNNDGVDVLTGDATVVIADWLARHGYVPVGRLTERCWSAFRSETALAPRIGAQGSVRTG